MKENKFIKIKKYCVYFILISLLVISLMGCANKNILTEENDNTDGLNIVTTIFPSYDFARQIIGNKGNVSMLLPPGAESHSYEPSPQDIIKIQKCDVFICTGGESEQWVEDVLESIDNNMKIIKLMDCVETLEKNSDEMKDSEKNYDEHVWTSPENAIDITKNISKCVCEIDSTNSEYYKKNTERYLQELSELSSMFRTIIEEGNRNTIVFGDRFPFRYFVKEYGLNYYSAFPGCSSETEPSVATLTSLTDLVKKDKIPVVFYIESSNHKTADMICEVTGAKLLLFHACHNLSSADMEAGKTYIDIMKKNAENLREALN